MQGLLKWSEFFVTFPKIRVHVLCIMKILAASHGSVHRHAMISKTDCTVVIQIMLITLRSMVSCLAGGLIVWSLEQARLRPSIVDFCTPFDYLVKKIKLKCLFNFFH